VGFQNWNVGDDKEFLKMNFTPNPSSIFKNEKIKFIRKEESLSNE